MYSRAKAKYSWHFVYILHSNRSSGKELDSIRSKSSHKNLVWNKVTNSLRYNFYWSRTAEMYQKCFGWKLDCNENQWRFSQKTMTSNQISVWKLKTLKIIKDRLSEWKMPSQRIDLWELAQCWFTPSEKVQIKNELFPRFFICFTLKMVSKLPLFSRFHFFIILPNNVFFQKTEETIFEDLNYRVCTVGKRGKLKHVELFFKF